jgi:hypothetical protein
VREEWVKYQEVVKMNGVRLHTREEGSWGWFEKL